MAGDRVIVVNGWKWKDVTNQSATGHEVYPARKVLNAGGDPDKARIQPDSSDD